MYLNNGSIIMAITNFGLIYLYLIRSSFRIRPYLLFKGPLSMLQNRFEAISIFLVRK